MPPTCPTWTCREHERHHARSCLDQERVRCYGLLQCYPARYFGIPEGLEGLEMKGFWTAASAHALHLPSIVVQVFKVLESSAKYVKIPKTYFRKVRCFPKDSGRFRVVSGGRNLRGGLPERSKSCTVLRVRKVLRKISASHGMIWAGF